MDTYPVQHSNHWLYLWPGCIYTPGSGNGEMGFVSIDRVVGLLVMEGASSEKKVAKEKYLTVMIFGFEL